MKTLLATAAATLALAAPAAADSVRDATTRELPSLMTLYRDLHANPEVSQAEVKTAAKLAAEARKAGYTVTEQVGGTGVVAVLKNGDGPVVLIRAPRKVVRYRSGRAGPSLMAHSPTCLQ